MRFSEQWLRDWINPGVSTEQLAHQLTMCGLEVDALEPVAPPFSNVVVGEVVGVEPHPDAARLRVCGVNVGNEVLTIVCGAPNVARGQKVPTALVGAELPKGIIITKAELRGVSSSGMLCSEVELGLADSSDGLMVLPSDAEPGMNLREYLQLDDYSIEVGVTPNRGDCLSVLGIAREVGVANGESPSDPEPPNVVITLADTFPVYLTAPEACPRYIGRVIKGVNPKAETPLWMRERLRRSGMRCISPIVDVTNYVMLELGQPMHAFDLTTLEGGVKIRYAEAGEKIRLLDEREVSLDDDVLVIADQNRAVAMAGIMGGADSAVSDETTEIFLESAHFVPDVICGRARRYGLHTDSAHRFERGVDYELPARAMKRATALLLEIVGGQAGPLKEGSYAGEHLPTKQSIPLRVERIKQVLGIELPRGEVTDMLTNLGMKVREQGKEWVVTPPSFRFDLAIESDLIEEVARVYGYDELPTHVPEMKMQINLPGESHISADRVRQLLVDRGYQEAITYSFVDAEVQRLVSPGLDAVSLLNPISADMSVMRTSLWPGLLLALKYNQNRQQRQIRMFERGVKFFRQGDEIKEETVIAGLVAGVFGAEHWSTSQRLVDFYDVKADLELLLGLTRAQSDYVFEAEAYPSLHSGQSAAIKTREGLPIGRIGKLHPLIEKQLDITGPVYLFEIDDRIFQAARKPEFAELSKYPSVRRDLAIVVDRAVSAQQVQGSISRVLGQYLENLQLFDVYCGEGVESGRKSLAFGLTLQKASCTLTDSEVDDLVSSVLKQLKQELNATLRE